MYVIKVLEGSDFVDMVVAGKFARKERAEGAMKFAERLGEKRPMRVELVNPGQQGNKGRTEHGAELATQEAKLEAKRAKNREYMRGYYQRKRAEAALVETVKVSTKDARAEELVVLSEEQVAKLIGSIRPGKPGSGEYLLDTTKLRPLAKVG